MTESPGFLLGLGIWALCLGPCPSSAHHSDAAYDLFQPITLHGTVAKFSWENPHIRVYVDVIDADGRRATWDVEGNPPGRIGGRGLKDALKVGDRITIAAYRARDRLERSALGFRLTLADGRRFTIGDDRD
jgi:uncharacterized protein DUF6152